jgi:hypothetical protein
MMQKRSLGKLDLIAKASAWWNEVPTSLERF